MKCRSNDRRVTIAHPLKHHVDLAIKRPFAVQMDACFELCDSRADVGCEMPPFTFIGEQLASDSCVFSPSSTHNPDIISNESCLDTVPVWKELNMSNAMMVNGNGGFDLSLQWETLPTVLETAATKTATVTTKKRKSAPPPPQSIEPKIPSDRVGANRGKDEALTTTQPQRKKRARKQAVHLNKWVHLFLILTKMSVHRLCHVGTQEHVFSIWSILQHM